jgi:SNF2 family DNA or RNA helicase
MRNSVQKRLMKLRSNRKLGFDTEVIFIEEGTNEVVLRRVVLTEWTSYLDLIEVALRNAGLGDKFTRLDGTMPLKKRTESLNKFRDDKNVTVILVSIKAGGLGLNLTSASKVYVMEPLFNPAAEAQAIDRVHRLGQTREVKVTRFIMNRSVEQRVLKIQEMKIKLADLSMNRNLRLDKEQESKRKLEELRELFK